MFLTYKKIPIISFIYLFIFKSSLIYFRKAEERGLLTFFYLASLNPFHIYFKMYKMYYVYKMY